MTFRTGESVVCIDANDSDDLLQEGACYQVRAVYGDFVAVEGIDVQYPGFWQSRFRPLKPERSRLGRARQASARLGSLG